MARRQQISHVILAVLLLAALLVLATSIAPGQFKAGTGLPPDWLSRLKEALRPPQFSLAPVIWTAAQVLFWGGMVLGLLLAVTTRETRRLLWRQSLTSMLLTVLMFLLVFIGWNSSKKLPQEDVEAPAPSAVSGGSDLATAVEQVDALLPDVNPESPLATVLALAFGVGLCLLLYLWWFRAKQGRKPHLRFDDLEESAAHAIEALRDGQRLDEVILRCYQQMTRVVTTQRGLTRDDWETPREYEAELTGVGLPADAVTGLTRLFEEVRYGRFAPNSDDNGRAIVFLGAIIEACRELDQVEKARRSTREHAISALAGEAPDGEDLGHDRPG